MVNFFTLRSFKLVGKIIFFLFLTIRVLFAGVNEIPLAKQEFFTINFKNQGSLLIPHHPVINAGGYILMDVQSGFILAQNNIDKKYPPASLAKIMTLYIAFKFIENGTISLKDEVIISENAWQREGSRMFLNVGSKVNIEKLIDGIIVTSGNDASIALAEYIAGSHSSFVDLMNRQAKLLGMHNTHFVNCDGLPEENNFISAKDIAILSTALIRNFPKEYDKFSMKSLLFAGIKQSNRNKLLWRYPYADGIKTGHTEEAKYSLAASATKDGMQLISVILGADSDSERTNAAINSLNYGFRFYETHLLYSASDVIEELKVWFGRDKNVDVGVLKDIYVTVEKDRFQDIELTIKINRPLKAPLEKGEMVGNLIISLNNRVIAVKDLYLLESVVKSNWFKNFFTAFSYLSQRWFGTISEKAVISVSVK